MVKFGVIISLLGWLIVPLVQGQQVKSKESIHLEGVYKLPDALAETSGLIYTNGLVWTFNDSGGEPELYGFSLKDSTIVSTLSLWNGSNYDWEEITRDSSNVYIGDIGNNFGTRNNLTIYIIKSSHLSGKVKERLVKSSKIKFTYPDYKPEIFPFKKLSAFDCEAMIWHNDSLYFFTKNWVSQKSSIYVIPAKPGKYIATKLGEFDSQGLITAANYYNGTLYLLGYQKNTPFLWKFPNADLRNVRAEDGTRYNLTMLAGAQTEGIAFVDDHTFFISAEKTKTTAHLYRLIFK